MFKELNPLLHSELRLAVMSILIGVESADFVFIRQQTGATAGNLSVQLDKLAKADYIEIEKDLPREDALHGLSHHGHRTRCLRRIRRGVADLHKKITPKTPRRNAAFVAVRAESPQWRGLLAVAAAKSIPEGHPYPNLNRKIYIVQKNVTRNGTLKSSTQPWKTDTTA